MSRSRALILNIAGNKKPGRAAGLFRGKFPSGRAHYLHFGYFEGRLPFKPEADAEWYAKKYPDVAYGLSSGNFKSAFEHFITCGYREGRQPNQG